MGRMKYAVIEPGTAVNENALRAGLERQVAAFRTTSNEEYLKPLYALSDEVHLSRPRGANRKTLEKFVSLLVRAIIPMVELSPAIRRILVTFASVAPKGDHSPADIQEPQAMRKKDTELSCPAFAAAIKRAEMRMALWPREFPADDLNEPVVEGFRAANRRASGRISKFNIP